MSKGGGVFGARAWTKKIKFIKSGSKEYSVIGTKHHKTLKDLPFDSFSVNGKNNILATYKAKNKKSNFESGASQGAYCTTVKNGSANYYIIAYDMPHSQNFQNVTSVSPGKLDPQMVWAGGSESLKISAASLIKKGIKADIDFWGDGKEHSAKVFPKEGGLSLLKSSILQGLKDNPLVSEEIVMAVKDYFNGRFEKFDLDAMSPGERLQIAKYGGEVFAGVAAFAGAKQPVFSGVPWAKHGGVLNVAFPTSSSFAGIDSLIIDKNGNKYPVSSKSGRGASASFIQNVLKVGLEHEHCLNRGSFFAALCGKYKDTTQAGPTFGFYFLNEILGLPDTFNGKLIPKFSEDDCLKMYKDLKADPAGRTGYSENIKLVMKLVEDWDGNNTKVTSPTDATIRKHLPKSIPAFLGRQIADKIMSEPKSVNQIQDILTGKKVYQFNLDLDKFTSVDEKGLGRVRFKVTEIENLKFKLTAGKGAAGDVTMAQGFLNYFLE